MTAGKIVLAVQAVQTHQKSCVQNLGGASKTCTSCHSSLTEGARFCEECGAAVGEPCPHCSAEVGGGDFCEACGTWLKAGSCRFCYAALVDGAAFCTECGNHQQGLWCGSCKTQHFFDFCGQCGQALSESAQQMAQQAPADPAVAAALEDFKALSQRASTAMAAPQAPAPAPPTPARPAPIELNLSGALQAVREIDQREGTSAQAKLQAAQAAREQAQAQLLADQARRAAEAAAREQAAQEHARRQQEMTQSQAGAFSLSAQLRDARERVKVLMEASAKLTFPDPQTARRHFMAMRRQMAREGMAPRKWLCNFATCEHDTPNECGDPSQGGRWLFD